MKRALAVYVLLMFVFCHGCTNNIRKRELIKTEKDANGTVWQLYRIYGDTIDREDDFFYPNGKLKERLFGKNDLNNKLILHGLCEIYYNNGQIKSKEHWTNNRRNGDCFDYDSLGRLKKIRKYVVFADTMQKWPNEVIRFDAKGDTIKNQSFYYDYYDTIGDDTLKKGNKYQFKIVLPGHLFNKTFLVLANYDEEFRLKDSSARDTFIMENHMISLYLDSSKCKIGENIVSGTIINYDDPTNDTDMYNLHIGKNATIYFRKKFYIKP